MVDFNRCIKCKYLTTHDTEYPCNVCEHRVETKDLYEPRTNADHIRSMSDEELARELSIKFFHGTLHEWILQWLKSETKE